jgi:dienelactone hydrolase
MAKLHVIYIPGIGDDSRGLQSKIVKTWRWWGVDAELWSMDWADTRSWRVKSKQLLDRIDSLSAEGRKVALVGASAGGSAVINIFAARKQAVVGVVCIAGKINNADTIGPRYRKKNRSFIESAEQAADSLLLLDDQDRSHILSRYGIYDELVPKRDSQIPGAHNRTVLSLGHGGTIATQIIFGAPSFLRFLKKQADTL